MSQGYAACKAMHAHNSQEVRIKLTRTTDFGT
jgi:hypothetical protein